MPKAGMGRIHDESGVAARELVNLLNLCLIKSIPGCYVM